MANNGDGMPFTRFWREIGIGAPDLRLRRAQLCAFTEQDYLELRDAYGCTAKMIRALRRRAADVRDRRDVLVDFAAQRVRPI